MSKKQSLTSSKKRATAKRQRRGADLVIHGTTKSKRDPFLQQRIDAVVEAAQARDQSIDVVRDIHISRFNPSGLKCHRVG